jgi:pSer/pThr/pTyr-binding forkhead associated (FHA) protein
MNMTPTIELTFMSGPRDGETVTLQPAGEPPTVAIGRAPDGPGAVCLPDDPEASRVHSRLLWRERQWWLEDLNSLNGTYLGEFGRGARLTQPAPIAPREIFRVGLTRLRLTAAHGEQS